MNTFNLTKRIPLKFSHVSVIGLLFIINMPSAIPADAPGTLANEPLHTSTSAKPNLMFIIDSSISMNADDVGASNAKRMDVAKTAAKAIIDGLGSVRVGVAKYNTDPGATILNNVADLTSSFKTTLKSSIDGITPTTGATPLAHSLRDIGRYFANGNTTAGVTANCGGAASTNLEIHPNNLTTDTPAKANVACTTLLQTGTTMPSTGPVEAWCQKSFAILLTDGLARSDRTGGNLNSNLLDYDYDCDGAPGTASTQSGYSCTGTADMKSGTAPIVGGTYAYDPSNSGTSDYVDDVAQALYEIDLQPALDDANGDEVKNNLHTYVIAMAATLTSTDPMLKETALQGGGEFIYADSTASLVSAFQNVTASIIAQTSTSSAVTFNSSTLSSQSAVYQALFNTARWSGELNSFPIDGVTGDIITNCTAGSSNCWNAASQLDAQTPANRVILTYGDANKGVEFAFDASSDDYTSLNSTTDIPWALVQDLCSSASGTDTAVPCSTSDSGAALTANGAYIEDLINYLRGDNTQEGTTTSRNFRVRTTDLGDIVNSSPVFVGAPQLNYPSTDPATGGFPPTNAVATADYSYRAWKKSDIKNRTKVVYTASNDGMLHAFRTEESSVGAGDAGNEIFAYVPTATFSTDNTQGLHYLANTNYEHRYYADLTPTIADAYMTHRNTTTDNDATTITPFTTDWRTVLLGGLGAGGKSLYLLDITDPSRFSTANAAELVLWEFSHATDLGYTYSKPTISMMNNGKFAAIFGNGYNSTSCEAKLFVVMLEGGLDGTWVQNTDYFIYDTGVGSTGGNCNGLSTPAVVDLDKNGTADRVYAGDLQGNLWAFDMCKGTGTPFVCSTDPNPATGWNIASANPIMYATTNSTTGLPRQPITVKPIVSKDPTFSGSDNLIIVFGTGQYLTNTDKTTTGTQSVYGVRDFGALTNAGIADWNKNPRKTPNKYHESNLTIDGTTGARTASSSGSMSDTDLGWVMDLAVAGDADEGERVVVNPKVRNNILFFNTLVPEAETCSFGGSGWLMSVNLKDGGSPPSPIFDLDGIDGIGNAGDLISGDVAVGTRQSTIPAESTFLGDNQYTPGSDGTISKRKVDIGETRREGRMSWKEVYEAQ